MYPLRPLALYQPTAKQLEVFAVDDNGAVTDVWKEHQNLSWRRHPLSAPGFVPSGVPLGGAFFEPQERLCVFLVALPPGTADETQGQVHWVSKSANGPWSVPSAIAPAGGPRFELRSHLAAALYPPHGTLEVVAASHDGAVWVLWMTETDPWRAQRIADPGFTKAGQRLASAFYPEEGTLEALMVDVHGSVQVFWKSATTGWRRAPITPPGIADALTHVALVYYDGYGQLECFLVDTMGRVLVLWKTASTPWQWVPLTNAGFAPSGAPIAAVRNPTNDQLEVFVVANDNALWGLWKANNEPWNTPVRLSEAETFAPRAPVAAAHFPPTDQLEVFVGDRLHFSREITKYDNRKWRPCALPIAPRSGVDATPEVETSRLMQVTGSDAFVARGVRGVDLGANTSHQGTHFIFFGDVPRGDRQDGPGQDADAVAYARFMDEGGMQLELITGADGYFAPFLAKFAPGMMGAPAGQSAVMELGNSQTPTGAFSFGGSVYVFAFVLDFGTTPMSYVFRSSDPFNGQPYEQVHRFDKGKFWQASPWVVPHLPELPANSGDGVAVLGRGFTGLTTPDAVHLAWIPLTANGPRFDQILYYTSPGAVNPWAPDEGKAHPLWFTKPGYSSISLAWIEGAKRWIALYSYAIDEGRQRSPVVARIGTSLIDWLPDEIVVFEPCRDGAYGNFMHWPDLDDHLERGGIPDSDVPAWAYGAFIVAPMTRWHPEGNEVTLHYLMSTHRPYQVQLMRSRFRIG